MVDETTGRAIVLGASIEAGTILLQTGVCMAVEDATDVPLSTWGTVLITDATVDAENNLAQFTYGNISYSLQAGTYTPEITDIYSE